MSDCPAFPYGRFNHSKSNLKLFPSISLFNCPRILQNYNPSIFTSGQERKRSNNIYSNTTHNLTKAQITSLLSSRNYNR